MIFLVPLLCALPTRAAAPPAPEGDAPPPPAAMAATAPVPSSVRALPAAYLAALREAGSAPRLRCREVVAPLIGAVEGE